MGYAASTRESMHTDRRHLAEDPLGTLGNSGSTSAGDADENAPQRDFFPMDCRGANPVA
jgi:hypothetical protein